MLAVFFISIWKKCTIFEEFVYSKRLTSVKRLVGDDEYVYSIAINLADIILHFEFTMIQKKTCNN